MVIILIISLLIQIALLIWFGKWAILIMAIGVLFIMALAWWETSVKNRVKNSRNLDIFIFMLLIILSLS